MQKIVALVALLAVAVTLHGCGGSGGETSTTVTTTTTTTATTTTTTTTTTTATTVAPTPPPTPPPGGLKNCMAKSRYAEDAQLCEEFYDSNIGISFSMLCDAAWTSPGNNPGVNGMDRAVFFEDAQTSYQGAAQQAMTVVTAAQAMAPYGGAGKYGVALHIGRSSKFWRYFQMNSAEELCGSPHDGFKCGSLPAWRLPITSKNYDWFEPQKNGILREFTGHNYNEFDVNGLSSTDLAGVFLNGKPVIDERKMCHFLRQANPNRKKPWPVYSYWYNTLAIEQYICESEVRTVVV